MPAQLVKAISSDKSPAELADAFDVSVDAMHQGPQGGGPCIAIIDAGE